MEASNCVRRWCPNGIPTVRLLVGYGRSSVVFETVELVKKPTVLSCEYRAGLLLCSADR